MIIKIFDTFFGESTCSEEIIEEVIEEIIEGSVSGSDYELVTEEIIEETIEETSFRPESPDNSIKQGSSAIEKNTETISLEPTKILKIERTKTEQSTVLESTQLSSVSSDSSLSSLTEEETSKSYSICMKKGVPLALKTK